MSRNKLDMLKEETDGLALAATHLQYSIARCADLRFDAHLQKNVLIEQQALGGSKEKSLKNLKKKR